MDVKEVKELIKLIDSSEIAYFEIKTEDGHIKMDKSMVRPINASEIKESQSIVENTSDVKQVVKNVKEVEKVEFQENEVETLEGDIIESPMVGTFYSSSSPEKNSFVNVGSKVKKGDVLCIIEAMKLMNEIEAEIDGTIVEIFVKNGDMVEYGTPLFKIKGDA